MTTSNSEMKRVKKEMEVNGDTIAKRLLTKRYGKRFIEYQYYPKDLRYTCEICTENCIDERPHDGCGFTLMDRDSLIKKIFIYTQIPTPRDDQEYIDNLLNAGFTLGRINLKDIYLMDLNYSVCKECNGTGSIIGHDSINECDKCNGTGLIKRNHKDFTPINFINMEYLGQPIIDNNLTANIPIRNKFITIYNGYTVIDETRKYVVFNEETNDMISGTYKEIHDKMGLEFYMDIEFISDDKYKVYTEEEFWEYHKIIRTSSNVLLSESIYNRMRSELMTSNLLLYSKIATYDCIEVLDKYVEKYSTIDMIIDNVMSHIDETENSVVLNDKVTYLDKIIADGKLIGMNLTKLEAAKIMESVISITGEDFYPKLLAYNTIAVFIVEFICISAEYDSLID